MNRDQVKKLFKRIQSNYPNFVVDDFKITEWAKELKDYDEADVHKKLEEHMRSEQYGNQEPKVYFLTKYLTKISDKNRQYEYIVNCNLCGKEMSLEEYEAHYEICLSIKTLQKWIKEKNGTDVTYDELASLDRATFEKVYKKYEVNENQELKNVLNKMNKSNEISEEKKYLLGE